LHDLRIDAAKVKLPANRRVDEFHRGQSKPSGELLATQMRRVRHFDYRAAERQAGPRWQVGVAQIEVNEELVARKLPAIFVLRYQGDGAGIHDVELHFGMGSAVGCSRTPTCYPAIADEALRRIEVSFFEDFTRFGAGTAYDEMENAFVLRRPSDCVQATLQLGDGQVLRGQKVGPPFVSEIEWARIPIVAFPLSRLESQPTTEMADPPARLKPVGPHFDESIERFKARSQSFTCPSSRSAGPYR
jgi:hypothetical protein